jgi:hypothetical protein
VAPVVVTSPVPLVAAPVAPPSPVEPVVLELLPTDAPDAPLVVGPDNPKVLLPPSLQDAVTQQRTTMDEQRATLRMGSFPLSNAFASHDAFPRTQSMDTRSGNG